MKKAKIIRIFLVPHVEVRIHVSKEMEEDYKKCYLSGRMYRCEKVAGCIVVKNVAGIM